MSELVGPRPGCEMKFYYNTGTDASPVWVLISEIGDLNVDLKRGVAVVERRANVWFKNLATLMDIAGVTFKMIHGLGQDEWAFIRDAFLAGTATQFAIANDLITNDCQALILPAIVEEFPWDQPLKDVVNHNVKLSTGFLFEDPYDETTEIDPWWYSGSGTVLTAA